MAIRHRTIIRQETTFSAGDAPIVDTLPVNPLSFVDITLRAANATANTLGTLLNLLAMLSNVEVLFKGSSFVSAAPRDLWALQHRMKWLSSTPQPRGLSANHRTALTLRVSFTRVPYWMQEGFPASRAGELQLRLTPAASFTQWTTPSLLVETEEILDAQFRSFLKYTTISRTPSATGESDADLPIGNPLVAVLLFATTVPTATAVTSSMRELRLLIDNQEIIIPRTRWDSLHQSMAAGYTPANALLEHIHLENLAGAYTQNADTGGPRWDAHPFANYGYLDFDPLMDGAYHVQTAGRSSVRLRLNADIADAQRIIPVEMIELAQVQPRA
jgi:hypothetical protein